MKGIACLIILSALSTSSLADEVVSELSRRSNIPETELRGLLKDCAQHQLSMNICAFRDFVKADLDMKKALISKLRSLPTICHEVLRSQQATWEASRDRQCNQETDAEAEGGSMRPMVFNVCRVAETAARTVQLRNIKSCDHLP